MATTTPETKWALTCTDARCQPVSSFATVGGKYMSAKGAIGLVREWHTEAVSLMTKLTGLPLKPKCEIAAVPARWAGRYWSHVDKCEYNLAYAMLACEKYRQTVIHEVCHAWQCYCWPRSSKHGVEWRELMTMAGAKPDVYHTHSVVRIRFLTNNLLLPAIKAGVLSID